MRNALRGIHLGRPLPLLAILAVAAYPLVSPALLSALGFTGAWASVLPVILTARVFGLRGGLTVAIAFAALNGLLLHLFGYLDWRQAAQWSTYLGEAAPIGLGALIGRWRDLERRARVTEDARACAERTLRERQLRLDALLAHSVNLLLVVDAAGRITAASASTERTLGYRPADLVGVALGSLVHADQAGALDERLAAIARSAAPTAAAEYRLRHRDGFWRDFETQVDSLLAEPAPGEVVVSLRDITGQKWTERRLARQLTLYETLLQAQSELGEGFLLVEAGVVRFANEALSRLCGYSLGELHTLPSVLLLFAREDRPALQARLAERGSAWSGSRFEATILRKDEGRVAAEVAIRHLDTADGPQIIAVIRDITERKALERQLAEERINSLVQNASDLIMTIDPDGTLKYVSPSAERVLGHGPDVLLGTNAFTLVHPADLPAVERSIVRAAGNEGARAPIEVRARHRDGTWRTFEAVGADLLREPSVGGIVVNAWDITERKRAEEALRQSEARYRLVVEQAAEGIFLWDPETLRIIEANPAYQHLLGYSAAELVELTLYDVLAPDRGGIIARALQPAEQQRSTIGEARHRRKDGSLVEVEATATIITYAGQRVGCAIVHDITERRAFETQLAHQAFHDALTGLPNRALFMNRLDHALARSGRSGTVAAVLFLDLDRFKVINDSLGHEVGDRLLVAVAARLRKCLRHIDTVARLGGDEFTVLLEDLTSEDEAVETARRITAALAAPFVVEGQGAHELFVTASIGIVFSSVDYSRPADLLRDADAAMYAAKARGKSRCEVFDPRMTAHALERLELEADLRRAVQRGEFVLDYQPKVDLMTGAIEGVEALVRWAHPERGVVPPRNFIPLAEETGLILPIGQWVLGEACRQGRAWLDRWPALTLAICVNLSVRQFQSPNLVAQVDAALRESGLPPANLQLEITESVVMEDAAATITTLGRLKDLGVGLAIDDFGTGYSSLSYLRRFPVDMLKIDRSFVDGLGQDPEDTAIVRAMLTLAKTLRLRVTAEGLESTLQLRELQALGCDLGQGFYFTRPLSAAGLEDLLCHGFPAVSSRVALAGRGARDLAKTAPGTCTV